MTADLFSHRERRYLSNMKKRQREELVDLVERNQVEPAHTPLRIQVLQSKLPDPVKYSIFDHLARCDSDKVVSWVKKAMKLPLGVSKQTSYAKSDLGTALFNAKKVMNDGVCGMDHVKREVLQLMCLSGSSARQTFALGLEGPAGCGKTHFVENALAPALERPLVKIPLGGASDASYLVGANFTYEGSKEGRLAAALVEAGCVNPIIHFDELDKISNTERGNEIESILIHIIDPSCPVVRDRYFHDIDLDFSQCTFVFGYNDASKVSPILLDRIKRVKVPPPDAEQREVILKEHMLPRVCEQLGKEHRLSDEAVRAILSLGDDERGMRKIEQTATHVLTSAHLCATLQEDARACGLCESVKVFDEDGAVTGEFADALVATMHVSESSAPLSHMYM